MDKKSVTIYDTFDAKWLSTLAIASISVVENSQPCEDKVVEELSNFENLEISESLTCSRCKTIFSDSQDQRLHYKLDWHRYNVKQSSLGKPTLSADEFAAIDDDVSSISGSESESDGGDDAKKIKNLDRFDRFRCTKLFLADFTGISYSLYKCVLPKEWNSLGQDLLLQYVRTFLKMTKNWFIVMLGGGHFAAAIFESGAPVVHKTMHCYTVRAKQGKSQSSKDNRNNNSSKSAGSSLRRYNEQHLVSQVHQIIETWSDRIQNCSLIFYRAVGPINRSILFGGKTPPLSKNDPRLRSIPFITRRATFSEVKRVHELLSTLQCHGPSVDLVKEFVPNTSSNETNKQVGEHFQLNSLVNPSPKKEHDRAKGRASPVRELPGEMIEDDVSSEDNYDLVDVEETLDTVQTLKEFEMKPKRKRRRRNKNVKKEFELMREQLVECCHSGNLNHLEQLLQIAQSWPSVSEDNNDGTKLTKDHFLQLLKDEVFVDTKDTLLHVASSSGHTDIVRLLLNKGSDPCRRNAKGQTPYAVSFNKPTKETFVKFREENPSLFDWKKSNIPEPLTEEQLKLVTDKKKEKKKEKRQRQKIRIEEENKLKIDENEKTRFLALSDREKCALAAEKRLLNSLTANMSHARTPVLIRCFQCGADITGKVPFQYNEGRFCSVECVKKHRTKTHSFGLKV